MQTVYIDSVVTNLVAAPIFIGLVALVREPYRQQAMAILLAFAGATYWQGGLGSSEFMFCGIILILAFAGLRNYWMIGLGWMVHTHADILHHLAGRPLVATIPMSSFGCAVFDPLIALWFFLGAPSPWAWLRSRGVTLRA